MSSDRQGSPCAPTLPIPLERVAGFLRSLSHDLRNTLSVLDLQATYAAQLSGDDQVISELRMIHRIIETKALGLRRLATHLQPIRCEPVACRADALLEDFRERLCSEHSEAAAGVTWRDESGPAEIAVDLSYFRTALAEVFQNAFQWAEAGGAIAAAAFVGEGRWVFELRETKSSVATPPATWGIEPFVSSRPGGCGIGLFHVRRIVATHGGEVTFAHDTARAELVTRLAFPLAE